MFDPKKIPSDESELAVYGNNKIEYLAHVYGSGDIPDIASDRCMSEWEGLRRLLANSFSHLNLRQMTKILSTEVSLREMHPNLTRLASIAAVIPVSTAECERLL